MNQESFLLCMRQFSTYLENHLNASYTDYLKGNANVSNISGMIYLSSRNFSDKIESIDGLIDDLQMIVESGADALIEVHYGLAPIVDAFGHFKTMYFNNDEYDLSNEFTCDLQPILVGVYEDLYDKVKQDGFVDVYGTAISTLFNIPSVMKQIKDVFYTNEDYKEMQIILNNYFNEK